MKNSIETNKVIKLLHKYYNVWAKKEIIKTFNEGLEYLLIDLADLETYNYKLVDLLRLYPDEMISLFESTIKDFKENKTQKDIKIRFINLPECDKIYLSSINIEHKGKLVKFKGLIKRKSDRLPKIKSSNYLCTNPSCNNSDNYIIVPQISDKLKKLKLCPKCRSGVELITEIETPFQQLVIEEDLSDNNTFNQQPKSKNTELEYDLTSPIMDNKLMVGSKVEVIGIVRSKHKEINGVKKTIGEFYIEAINIQPLEENLIELNITKEEKEELKQISKQDNLMQLLINSIAPNIAGREEQKLASLFYAVGGSDKEDKKTKIKQRSHIHIKIIGNASLGKSQILKRLKQLLPKTVYVSAENASNAGIIGTVVRDEFTGHWAVEAGSMPMANGGYYLQDESDKLRPEDLTKQNQALEDGVATINKAGLNIDLKCDCPCFSVANPKKGRFNDKEDYIKQINFDPTYLSRFDLIFILDGKDGDEEQDLVLDKLCGFEEKELEMIEDDKLRKYLMLAKSINPTIERDLLLKLQNYYKQISALAKRKNSIDITYRQFTGLIRMSEARAKLHLRNKVLMEDVKAVINLMEFTLQKLDLSEISVGISNNSTKLYELIPEVITILKGKGERTSEENIIRTIESMTTRFNKLKISNMLKTLIIEGELFSPRRNQYEVIQ